MPLLLWLMETACISPSSVTDLSLTTLVHLFSFTWWMGSVYEIKHVCRPRAFLNCTIILSGDVPNSDPLCSDICFYFRSRVSLPDPLNLPLCVESTVGSCTWQISGMEPHREAAQGGGPWLPGLTTMWVTREHQKKRESWACWVLWKNGFAPEKVLSASNLK